MSVYFVIIALVRFLSLYRLGTWLTCPSRTVTAPDPSLTGRAAGNAADEQRLVAPVTGSRGFLPQLRCAALPPRQQNHTLSPDAPRRKCRKLSLAKYKQVTLTKLRQ